MLACGPHHQLLERCLWIDLNHLEDLLGHFLINSVFGLGVRFSLKNKRSESVIS